MSSAVRETSSLGPLARGDQVALLHRTLADLCRSEVPLPEALRAAADDLGGGALAGAVRAMADDVESGTPLGEAYAARAESFPRLYRGLVEAGLAAGDLPGVLAEIAQHAEARADAELRMRRALAYPAVAAGFVVVIGAALAVTVGPQLDRLGTEIVASQGGALAGAADRGIASAWAPLLLAGGFAAVLGAFVVLHSVFRRPLDGARGVRALAFRWPVLGRLRLYATLATVAAALALLLRRRTPLGDALSLAASGVEEPRLRARLESMADAAASGASLADALREGDVFAPSLVWTIDAAERRGDAEAALDDVARVYRDRLSRAVDRAALWITPAAEVVVGLLVLIVAGSFLGKLLALTRMVFTTGA